jgi:hypothetical protein
MEKGNFGHFALKIAHFSEYLCSASAECMPKPPIFAPKQRVVEMAKFVQKSSKICKNRIKIREKGDFNTENYYYGK